MGFLGGCTEKKPDGFFGYIPGCLNTGVKMYVDNVPDIIRILKAKVT